LGELQRIVAGATGVVGIFGPTVAAPAIRAGLVEEFQFFVVPKLVGGGLRALPDDVRLELTSPSTESSTTALLICATSLASLHE
jgi:dihydrofolate reductase